MSVPLNLLLSERDQLHRLSAAARDEKTPITLTIGDHAAPESLMNKARWGVTNYIMMRLREIDRAIAEIKKENA